MTHRTRSLTAVVLAVLCGNLALVASTAASAHSFWLEPELHTVDPGEEVEVSFRIGDAGDAGDWGLYGERIASLRLYGPDGAVDQQRAVRTTGPDEVGTARISVPEAGSYVLAFESNPSFSNLEAARFDAYVEHEGLRAIAEHRRASRAGDTNGTELYARRAKALLQIGEGATGNVTRPVGQTLEIVPLANPIGMRAGETLPVQVLWRGAPLEGASLAVVRPYADNETEILLTDSEGKARFELKHGSRYLLSVVWGEPAPNDARADYFTIFASLTFASPY